VKAKHKKSLFQVNQKSAIFHFPFSTSQAFGAKGKRRQNIIFMLVVISICQKLCCLLFSTEVMIYDGEMFTANVSLSLHLPSRKTSLNS